MRALRTPDQILPVGERYIILAGPNNADSAFSRLRPTYITTNHHHVAVPDPSGTCLLITE
jgi:hypothetical protein